mmetsp:Transcript_3473/g.10769  ORF Transcript_3473/g.10769 Transcript_3473/m.10769 type:complete len:205 (+) Transcript_3473:2-616(+)
MTVHRRAAQPHLTSSCSGSPSSSAWCQSFSSGRLRASGGDRRRLPPSSCLLGVVHIVPDRILMETASSSPTYAQLHGRLQCSRQATSVRQITDAADGRGQAALSTEWEGARAIGTGTAVTAHMDTHCNNHGGIITRQRQAAVDLDTGTKKNQNGGCQFLLKYTSQKWQPTKLTSTTAIVQWLAHICFPAHELKVTVSIVLQATI